MTKIPLNGVWVLFTAEMLKKEWRAAIIMIQEQEQDNGALHESRSAHLTRWDTEERRARAEAD